MTAGVVVILGPVGKNLGSGMTGGLVYLAREALREGDYHPEFVCPAEAGYQEHIWLRRVLREHLRLTGSPRAAALLGYRGALPLFRIEPVRLPCPVAQTWAAAGPLVRRRERALPPPVPARQVREGTPLEAVS